MDEITTGNIPLSMPGNLTERILVLAPTGDDAELITEILGSRGFDVVIIGTVESVVTEWGAGAGAVLIASEALNDAECCTGLRQLLDAQDSWSEIPVVIMGGPGEDDSPRVVELLGKRVQLLMLERPLGIVTFVSAVEAALRSRRRQSEVKALLDELAASAIRIREAHEEADRTKDEFLATLAHELRSPMTAIRGWVEMLKVGGLDPVE